MPRQNPFFDNLSETPLLSEQEATQVLVEYCEENNINLDLISNDSLDSFIDTIRYAPYHIETEEIARRIGVARQEIPQYIYTSTSLRSRQERVQEVLDTMDLDTVEAMAQQPSISDFLTMDSLDSYYNYGTINSTPKQKKRQRSERDMMMEIVRSNKFPRPNFKDWSNSREFENIMNDWYSNVDYREQWIFSRREREGFNRRNVGQFNLDDVMARMSKRKKPHELDSSFSKFYDWKLGGTDWILRLELFQHEQTYFLITRHIHKPTESEIKFDVRYWSKDRFKSLNAVWCQQRDNAIAFERIFGSNDENSPFYVRPHEEDDLEPDYDEDYDSEEDNEDGDW